ncbi:MAG: Sir2 family NAD-dependent protein deacetylase [Planctomycetota bacterium]
MEAQLDDDLRRRLRDVRSAAVVTGAGISAESGIRTYRGRGGIYDDPASGDATIEALSGTTLVTDPDRTWRVIADLARQARDARPNPAHLALAELERRLDHCVVLTQNVDGLHREAGSENLIEIHGRITDLACMGCDRRETRGAEELADLTGTPLCADCGGLLRPGVVLFGEMLPLDAVAAIHREIYQKPADLTLVVGTSALFPYVTEPVHVARAEGRLTVEIDPAPTALSGHVDHALRGPAGLWLPVLAAAIEAGR